MPLPTLRAAALGLSALMPLPAAADDAFARLLFELIAQGALSGGAAAGAPAHHGYAPIIEPPRHRAPRIDHGKAPARAHLPHHEPRRDHRTLPAACVRDVYGYDSRRRVVAAPCLERRDVRAILPGACRKRLPVGQRMRTVYEVRCLRGRGFRFR